MSLREKIASAIHGYGVSVSYGASSSGDDLDTAVGTILAAIEAERPAIEAAERERLAKVFEDCGLEMYSGSQVADEIRSQGEEHQHR